MTVLGMPTGMFLVFVATVIAGSIGALHYLIVHIIMDKPVAENIREEQNPETDGGVDNA